MRDWFGGGPHGNGLRWLSEAFLFYPMSAKDFISLVWDCYKKPGLLNRGPWEVSDQEGPDDYIAVVSAAYQVSLGICNDIYNYGYFHKTKLRGFFTSEKKTNLWLWKTLDFLFGWIRVRGNYNNVEPGKMHRSSWLWRMPQVRAHMEFAAGVNPAFWRVLWWCVCVATSGRKGDNDSWALAWHLAEVGEDYNWLTKLAHNRFMSRFEKAHPKMMYEVSPILKGGL